MTATKRRNLSYTLETALERGKMVDRCASTIYGSHELQVWHHTGKGRGRSLSGAYRVFRYDHEQRPVDSHWFNYFDEVLQWVLDQTGDALLTTRRVWAPVERN